MTSTRACGHNCNNASASSRIVSARSRGSVVNAKPASGREMSDIRKACRDSTGTASHMLKLLPQPQVVFAFGLRITNCAPVRLSV